MYRRRRQPVFTAMLDRVVRECHHTSPNHISKPVIPATVPIDGNDISSKNLPSSRKIRPMFAPITPGDVADLSYLGRQVARGRARSSWQHLHEWESSNSARIRQISIKVIENFSRTGIVCAKKIMSTVIGGNALRNLLLFRRQTHRVLFVLTHSTKSAQARARWNVQ
jgi:hypothetical protein